MWAQAYIMVKYKDRGPLDLTAGPGGLDTTWAQVRPGAEGGAEACACCLVVLGVEVWNPCLAAAGPPAHGAVRGLLSRRLTTPQPQHAVSQPLLLDTAVAALSLNLLWLLLLSSCMCPLRCVLCY